MKKKESGVNDNTTLNDDEADVPEFGREDHGRILPVPETEGLHANEILVAVRSNGCVGYEGDLAFHTNIDPSGDWLKERLRGHFRVFYCSFQAT